MIRAELESLSRDALIELVLDLCAMSEKLLVENQKLRVEHEKRRAESEELREPVAKLEEQLECPPNTPKLVGAAVGRA